MDLVCASGRYSTLNDTTERSGEVGNLWPRRPRTLKVPPRVDRLNCRSDNWTFDSCSTIGLLVDDVCQWCPHAFVMDWVLSFEMGTAVRTCQAASTSRSSFLLCDEALTIICNHPSQVFCWLPPSANLCSPCILAHILCSNKHRLYHSKSCPQQTLPLPRAPITWVR